MRLTYTGGLDSLTLHDDAGTIVFERILNPGHSYEFPEHEIVDGWEARGLLIEPGDADPHGDAAPPPVDDTSQLALRARKVRRQREAAPAGDPETQE